MRDNLKYNFSNYAIIVTVLLSVTISYFFKWENASSVNFVDGDAKDYYSYLISTFVNHDLAKQAGNDWYLLHTGTGTINVHPVGVSILLLPFFGLAYLFARAFNFPPDGTSLPFQLAIAVAALTYAVIGLIYIKKTLKLHGISDKVTALVILLIFFGTNLLNYTITEALMSHIYSFSLISIFLYHSSKYVLLREQKNLLFSGALMGLIVLIRPNNILILLSVFIWFKNASHCKEFFRSLFTSKVFYLSSLLTMSLVFVQSLIWYFQSHQFFHHTYKADGFYWLDPQIFKMLFGFNGGFFIYVPLCFLFLLGLWPLFKENKFRFIAFSLLLLGMFYFFASYWAYTYFDGLGIRVLVDYYALFSFLGAKLFSGIWTHKLALTLVSCSAFFLAYINLVYCYQNNAGIMQRAGMTFNKWKYIFLHTGAEYRDCLGGCNDLVPYASEHPTACLSNTVNFDQPVNFAGNEWGVGIAFDSIGFDSNRLHLKINLNREEAFANSSKDAVICVSMQNKRSKQLKSYYGFRINDTPSTDCCENNSYEYSVNIMGDYKNNDRLIIYLWNRTKQAFKVNKFSVQVFNYNYQIN